MKLLILSLMFFLFVGCGIKTEVIESGQRTVINIDEIEKFYIKENSSIVNNPLYIQYKEIADKENLLSSFEKAKKEIEELSILKISINDLIKNNSSKTEMDLISIIGQSNGKITAIKNNVLYIHKRLELYSDFEKNRKKYELEMEAFYLKLSLLNNELFELKLKMKEKYPEKKGDIEELVNPILDSNKVLAIKLLSLSSEKDIASFLSIYDNIILNGEKIIAEIKDTKGSLGSLDISIVKIVKEAKKESFFLPTIFTWDEGSDGGEGQQDLELFKVSNEAADLAEKDNVELIATYGARFLSGSAFDCITSEIICKEFYVFKNNLQYISSYHNHGELWISDIQYKYYINYLLIENGVVSETGLKEVSEEEFEEYGDAVGKEIYSKPLGFFDSEAVETANPIGAGFVNNPKYGEWKTDSSGNSFWHYYGQYAFITNLMDSFGNRNNYSRDNYNTWKKEEQSSGGSASVRTRNKESGINRSGNNSIRGVGHTARGRGSNGGGK